MSPIKIHDGNNYYAQGKVGWSESFADRPTATWIPVVPPSEPTNTLVVQAASDSLNPIWTPVATIKIPDNGLQRFYQMRASVVEVAVDLKNPIWVPVATLNLTINPLHQLYRLVPQ